MKAFHKNQKGFTLVELMVVVVIIGVLVAIAIPIFNTVQARAERSACHANLRTIDGMKSQWQMMTAAERTAVPPGSAFSGMFQGGNVPVCPSGGVYTNATTGLETDRATCGAGAGGVGNHGTAGH